MAHHLTGRTYWLNAMRRVAEPLLVLASQRKLRSDLPLAIPENGESRARFFTLESVARLLDGIAPWLENESVQGEEAELQARYREMAVAAIAGIVDPASPDRCDFSLGEQVIVDAAFLASALVRAPKHLAQALPEEIQSQLVADFRELRHHKPHFNNWLLFSAVVEVYMHTGGHGWDPMRLDYAIRQHEQWYKGDGIYGDGPDFHWDYYNSFVIQPMLLLIKDALDDDALGWLGMRSKEVEDRAVRYAEVMERMISPEGTYPIVGRSIAYRFGAFQHLALMAQREKLPEGISSAQVRCALEAVIRRTMDAPGSEIFDDKGFLQIGLVNHQPGLGERYISTASCYLCSEVFLPLGLPVDHEFWTGPETPWTSKKVWGGADLATDHALYHHW